MRSKPRQLCVKVDALRVYSRKDTVMQSDMITNQYYFYHGDALDVYINWPLPQTIISDGAYGIRGFEGDTVGIEGLIDWYLPHFRAWDTIAMPATTLWFWNTEIGWATVHPVIESHGWKYVQTVIWDKGISHIAGNVNGKTIRQFPVVSEICVLYQRHMMFNTEIGPLDTKTWLRYEWERSGLAFSRANEACGVKNAATRKYLTKDWLWYWPPGEMVEKMAEYANTKGNSSGAPYFSLDGRNSVCADEWDNLRYKWNHIHGITNVWAEGPLHGKERIKGGEFKSAPRSTAKTINSAMHFNQKPVEFMRRMITASTDIGDVVWEPFGGTASASVAAIELGRYACVAEINDSFQGVALNRIHEISQHSPLLELIV